MKFNSSNKANMKLAVIGLTVTGIVIAALVASALILTPQDQTTDDGKTPTEGDKNSWLFIKINSPETMISPLASKMSVLLTGFVSEINQKA